MMMVAGMSSSLADRATAWAWLPEEKLITPARRCSGVKRDSALNAPRNLKAPMRWKFSHLKKTEAPSASSTVREVRTGVRRACPCRRSEAAATSS
jgi:hypothetical protein